jgi:hypothetical protein
VLRVKYISLFAVLAALLLACGGHSSLCNRAGSLCAGNIDYDKCDSQLTGMASQTLSDLTNCTKSATTCDQARACFNAQGLVLPPPQYCPYVGYGGC